MEPQLTANLIGSAAHVFVESLDVPVLSAGDEHHLLRVLRLRDGEAVSCSDGRGSWVPCRVASGALRLDGEQRRGPLPRAVSIAFAVPKGDRPERIVQQLTELGVTSIVPLSADHSVVRWEGDRGAQQVERLRRVAREAAMQSRRCWLPSVDDVTPVAAMWSRPGVVVAVPGVPTLVDAPHEAVVMIGPEGGWSTSELQTAVTHGVPSTGLGQTVLRVETACVAAALLCASTRI